MNFRDIIEKAKAKHEPLRIYLKADNLATGGREGYVIEYEPYSHIYLRADRKCYPGLQKSYCHQVIDMSDIACIRLDNDSEEI